MVAKVTLLFAFRCYFIIYFYICRVIRRVTMDSMQALLTDIELDIQELKCLVDTFTNKSNPVLLDVTRRSILQMRARLDQLLLQLEGTPVSEAVVLEPQDVSVPQPNLPEYKSVENPLVAEPQTAPSLILAERIKPGADLRHSVSLNDSFRFARELFGGDGELMNRTLQQIGEMSSLDTALAFLSSKIKVDPENDAMADFMELLKKYFH